MRNILKEYNFLNESEIEYLNNLSKNFIVHQFDIYHQTNVDYSKIKSYQLNINKFISENLEDSYRLKSIELNRITDNDKTMNGYHQDHCDLTFVTYFNTDFEGGDFEYIDDNDEHIFIKPEVNLTLIMDKNPLHRVNKVTRGERFSLVAFFVERPKNEKKSKTFI